MQLSRRGILKTGAVLAAPTIVPSSVFGQNAPSNRIVIGAIGVGRISRSHDMKEVHKHDDAQIVAVCDVDTVRLGAGKRAGRRTLHRQAPASPIRARATIPIIATCSRTRRSTPS